MRPRQRTTQSRHGHMEHQFQPTSKRVPPRSPSAASPKPNSSQMPSLYIPISAFPPPPCFAKKTYTPTLVLSPLRIPCFVSLFIPRSTFRLPHPPLSRQKPRGRPPPKRTLYVTLSTKYRSIDPEDPVVGERGSERLRTTNSAPRSTPSRGTGRRGGRILRGRPGRGCCTHRERD